MNKLQKLPNNLPRELLELFSHCDVYDSSSSPEARVYYADTNGGYFIKVGEKGALQKELVLTKYFHSIGLGAEVFYSSSYEKDILVTKKVKGYDLTTPCYLNEPRELAKKMGEALRKLHETPPKDCPIQNRTEDYLATFREGYKIGRFDPSYIDKSLNITSAECANEYIRKNQALLQTEVLLHGDFCLPNIIFDRWKLSGYIDLGGGGIGDRHIDLFWGAWTLNFNLHTEKYRDTFFDAYGRDKVDEEKLLLVSAIEAFG